MAGLVLALIALVGLLAAAGLPSLSLAAGDNLPPRPTPTPSSTPEPTVPPTPGPLPSRLPPVWPEPRLASPAGPAGAEIELRLAPGTVAAGELWTVVQWQDSAGRWHDVEGWQGAVHVSSSGPGIKVWWVADSLLGQGPFRWLVLSAPGGERLASSAAFNLPDQAGERLIVVVP